MDSGLVWTGSAGNWAAATADGQRLEAYKESRGWITTRDGARVGVFSTLREAKTAALEAAERAAAWDGEADPKAAVAGEIERPAPAPAPVSRQVRRALERAARKRATRPGPHVETRTRSARSLSAAAVGEPRETVRAVPWSVPVRPLTGATQRAVYGGTTPPEQVRAAAYAFHRQAGLPARKALERTREDVAAGKVRFPAFHHNGAGAVFSAYGESRLRWIERPEEYGLRLVGLAHDIPGGNDYARRAVDHSGWYLDSFQDETVAGVVYQLPARDGRARYLAGYADPFNTDSRGRGPACLSLDVIEGEPGDHSGAVREAARAADGIAERMAEAEREYQEAWAAGRAAREAAAEALETGRALVAACRDARALWRARGGSPVLPAHMARAALRETLQTVRALREAYAEALETARGKRADGPARRSRYASRSAQYVAAAFWEAYGEAV